jgi:ABC-2 type transport system permease protein
VSFGRLLALLFALRLRLTSRRPAPGARLGAGLSAAVGLGLAVGAAWGTYVLVARLLTPAGPIWLRFGVSLLTFLLGLLWLLWPLIAAQVDEAFELSRFAHFPLRPRRLYLAQTLLSLVEPAALLFYAPLCGLLAALAPQLPIGQALGLCAAYVLMSVTCGRALANAMLGLLTSRRSSELLLSGVLALLLVSFAMPSVDVSWLSRQLSGLGAGADLRLLVRGAASMQITPGGWLATGLIAAMLGRTDLVIAMLGLMLGLSALAWPLGLVALKRFYRGGQGLFGRRANKTKSTSQDTLENTATPNTATPNTATQNTATQNTATHKASWRRPLWVLLRKELTLLYANPRTRLLFVVPFFLLILLKIVGGPQLFAHLAGPAWAAWLLAVLASYLVTMLAAQLFANGLGYEGPALLLALVAPQPLWRGMVARNLAQALLATLQFVGLTLLTLLALPGATAQGLAFPLALYPFILSVALATGNLLSLRYPRRFSASLRQRDRVPPAAAAWLLLVLTLAGAIAAGLWRATLALETQAPLLVLPLLGLGTYAATLPRALRILARDRGRLLAAIARRE